MQKARSKPPQKSDVWLFTALISFAQRQQDWVKSARLLDEAQKLFGDTVGLRMAQAEDVTQRKDPKAVDCLQKLAENAGRFSAAEREQLWAGLANMAIRVNDLQHAKQFCQRVAEKQPYNLEVHRQLFELALRAGDEGGMSQARRDLRGIAGPDAYWHYGQALRLSRQARDANKDEAAITQALGKALQHLAEARELQPTWSPVLVLTGAIREQQGKTDSALKNYLEAIDLGEREPEAIQRAILLLFEEHRYADANALLRHMERQQLPFSPDTNRANAMVALYRGDFDRALDLARKAASARSQSYQEHIWLGQVLGIVGRWAKEEGRTKKAEELLAEGERALRHAVEIEPKTGATWVALIQFLAAGGAKDQAEKAIREASRKIPAQQASLVLAQCYEAAQNTEAAQQKYEAAAAAAPRDPLVARAVADFYCRSKKTALAEPLLQRIVGGQADAPEADVLWARRQLAMITVARNGYENRQKARDLIDKNLAVAEASVLDQRLKANLDAADPAQSRRKAAIATLEAMVEGKSASPDDRFQLAQMYLATGNWLQASTQFRNLVASYEDEPRYLAAYIAALLEHRETISAEIYLGRLEKTRPDSVDTVNLRARILVQKGEPEKAIELLNAFIDKPKAQPSERKVRLRMVAMQLEQLGGGS